MPFTKATRTQKKLRMALEGPSGSGKTYTALEIASGLGNKIALVDTERGSASLYGDKFAFDTLELDYFGVDNYIKAITEAAEAGYDVLVIDSLSHAWTGVGGVLDSVNNTKGNSFSDGWGKVGTPQQNRLMDTILKAPLHIIVTLRVKTEYIVEKDERGKSVPRKVGTTPVQRDGAEYEFDIVGTLSIENTLSIDKSRMIDLAGKIIPKPTRKVGAQLLEWLNGAVSKPAAVVQDDAPAYRKIVAEELSRLNTWATWENGALVSERAAIIECYKAVKAVALDIKLEEAVHNNPASSTKSAAEIRDAARAIATACDTALAQPA